MIFRTCFIFLHRLLFIFCRHLRVFSHIRVPGLYMIVFLVQGGFLHLGSHSHGIHFHAPTSARVSTHIMQRDDRHHGSCVSESCTYPAHRFRFNDRVQSGSNCILLQFFAYSVGTYIDKYNSPCCFYAIYRWLGRGQVNFYQF